MLIDVIMIICFQIKLAKQTEPGETAAPNEETFWIQVFIAFHIICNFIAFRELWKQAAALINKTDL